MKAILIAIIAVLVATATPAFAASNGPAPMPPNGPLPEFLAKAEKKVKKALPAYRPVPGSHWKMIIDGMYHRQYRREVAIPGSPVRRLEYLSAYANRSGSVVLASGAPEKVMEVLE